MSQKPIIKVENISKLYKLGMTHNSSLRDVINNTWGSLFSASKGSEPKQTDNNHFWALKDISFEVFPGDVVGIIGRNGAGKSTLLKILSRITTPTTGRIEMHGRVASLLEVGTGFHHELTGRENVYLNGMFLGMNRHEIKKQFDAIVDFSGVEKFIDTPVKRYSSGMSVRLGFAIAAHLQPEILIVDEVLAVGDIEFQRKCLGKMKEVSETGRTILFVSHNMGSVNELCSSCVLIEKGKIGLIDTTNKCISQYMNDNSLAGIAVFDFPRVNENFWISRFEILDGLLKPKTSFCNKEDILLRISYIVDQQAKGLHLSVWIVNSKGVIVFITQPKHDSYEIGSYQSIIPLPSHILPNDTFTLNIVAHYPNSLIVQQHELFGHFNIEKTSNEFNEHYGKDIGTVLLDISWKTLVIN